MPNLQIFENFTQLLKKNGLPEDFELLGKKESHPSAPWPITIHKLSMMSMICNISTGQLGLAAWLCSLPALVHQLIS